MVLPIIVGENSNPQLVADGKYMTMLGNHPDGVQNIPETGLVIALGGSRSRGHLVDVHSRTGSSVSIEPRSQQNIESKVISTSVTRLHRGIYKGVGGIVYADFTLCIITCNDNGLPLLSVGGYASTFALAHRWAELRTPEGYL